MAAVQPETTPTPIQTQDAWPWPAPPDPGDLSRRLVQRRTELKLSPAQVAERARVSVRYLEYLERFPARPAPAVLRQLGAALRTTPGALLGGGADVPSGHRLGGCRRFERLLPGECRRLIAPGGIGRIAFTAISGPVVLPVNFAVAAGTVIIRTGEGSAIAGHAFDTVAFEVDHIDEALAQGWSVLVRGQAHLVLQPAEHANLSSATDLKPWPAGERDLFVRIVPQTITGRRIWAQ